MNGAASVQDEAGATDNRMYWGLDEFPATKDMQDEGTYRVTATVRQVSGGQGQILSIDKVEPAEPGEGTPEEESGEPGEEGMPSETPTDMSGRGMGTGNPAVDRLIGQGPKQ